MRLTGTWVIIGCLTVAAVAARCGAETAGTTGANILEIAPDARTTAMGEAFSAIADDAYGIYYNPAGLGTLRHTEIAFANNSALQGIRHQHIAFAYSLRDVRTENVLSLGTLAVTFTDLNSGSMTGRDEAGADTGDFTVRDQVFTLAYGKPVYDSETAGTFYLGAAGKFIDEALSDARYQHNVIDAGALWQMPDSLFSLGVAAQNLGGRLGYHSHSFDPPTAYRAGIGFRDALNGFTADIDVINPIHGKMMFGAGGEYRLLNSALALRAGYNSRADQGMGLSAGIGLLLRQVDVMFFYARDVAIDYAFVPYGDLGDMHRISLTLKLGAD